MCGIADNDEDLSKSRRPGTEEPGWSSTSQVLDGRTIRRSDDVVYGLHRAQEDEERGFLS
jgi:hypothetical protein